MSDLPFLFLGLPQLPFLVCPLPNVSSKHSLCLLCVCKNTIIPTEAIIYAQFRNMLFFLFNNYLMDICHIYRLVLVFKGFVSTYYYIAVS